MTTQTLEPQRENASVQSEPVTLTALDRCDRCGAAAKARASLNGQELLFCGHDIHKLGEGLEQKGFHISPSNWRDFLGA